MHECADSDAVLVDELNFPAIALTVWVVAMPNAGSGRHNWIAESKCGVKGLSDVEAAMATLTQRPFTLVPEASIKVPSAFDSLQLCAYAHRNALAQ